MDVSIQSHGRGRGGQVKCHCGGGGDKVIQEKWKKSRLSSSEMRR